MSAHQQQLAGTAPGHPGAPGYFPNFSTVNFYAGSGLSRFSWLRNDSAFLNAALTSPRTRFVVLQHLNPLIHTGEGERQGELATLSWKEVEPTIRESQALSHGSQGSMAKGEGGIFGPDANHLVRQGEEQDKHLTKLTDGLVPTSLALVFLGVDEGDLAQGSLPGDMASTESSANTPAGTPYFALSVTHKPTHLPSSTSEELLPIERLEKELLRDGRYDFVDTRTLAQAGTWKLHDAAVVAQARSLIDWNERHQVRRGGSETVVANTDWPIAPASSARRAAGANTACGRGGSVRARLDWDPRPPRRRLPGRCS